MAIANKNDLTHIVRTTQQWTSSYDSYECIPEGVLCVEFTSDGHVKAKIGNGHDIFSKLPYIGGADLTNYFTKNETVKCVEDIIKANRFIRIKGILQNKDQLPSNAECGDLYFVISQNQSSSNKYDEYVYSPSNTWETLGSIPIDIDLSEYAKIVYVDEKIDEVNERIDDIEQHGTHTHANKDILDLITAAFTAEEKDKLSTLYNYDDTELRELITQASHTHSNKDILDAISAAFTTEDRTKLDSLTPYDDSILREKITALERLAHEHSNKRILDQTTASFTTEYERKMRWIRIYTGCTGMEEGIAGLVPAAQAGEEDYVLSGSGEWVPQTGGGGTYTLPIATASTLGGIKVGNGLEIDANGVLSTTGGGGGGDSITEGDGITITTDPQTGVKTISVNTGDNLEVDPNTGELNVTGVDYTAGKGIFIGNEYQNVEYIKNSGNYDQIILTDIIPSSTDRFEMDIKFGAATGLDNNKPIYGAVGTNQRYDCAIWMNDIHTYTSISTYNHFTWQTERPSNVIDASNTIKYEGNNPRQLLTVTRNTVTWGNVTTDFSDQIDQSYTELNIPIAIFGKNVSNTSLAPFVTFELTVYGVKLYDSNDTLLHNLVPVKKLSNNEGGLYDTVTNKFYGNSGNGSFVTGPAVETDDRIINVKIGNGLDFDSNNAIEVNTGNGLSVNQDNELEVNLGSGLQFDSNGAIEVTETGVDFEAGNGLEMVQEGYFDRLPLETYSHCDYVENTNDARCQINYTPPQTVRVIGKFSLVQTLADAPLFGSRSSRSTSGHQFVLWCSAPNNTLPYTMGFVSPGNSWGTSSEANSGHAVSFVQNDIINFDIDFPNTQVLTNDDVLQPIAVSSSAVATINLGIFAIAKSNTPTWENKFCGKIYGIKFYEGNALVVNLVPAVRDSDSVVGFYDNVNDVFYTSITSTAFATDPSTITKDEPSTQTINVLNVIPATAGNIGGIIPRRALTVDLKGRLDVDLATSTTPGIVTPKEGLNVDANGELTVTKATSSTMGGIKIGNGFITTLDGTLNAEPAMHPFEVGDGLELVYDSEDALPSGYGYVDYVWSNPSSKTSTTGTNSVGRAYTKIDYIPTNATRIIATFENWSYQSDSCIVGSRYAGRDQEFELWFEPSGSSSIEAAFIYGGTGYDSGKVACSYNLRTQVTLEGYIENGSVNLKINDTLAKTYSYSGNISPYKLGIFRSNKQDNGSWEYNPTNAKIYSVKIYEGDTLAVNLIPAVRLVDEVVGFYDNISDKFYTSVTSYPFITDMSTLVIDGTPRTMNVIPATANTIGGIKVGDGLSIDADGTLSVVGGSGGGNYSAGEAIEFRPTQLSFNVDAIRWDISNIKSTSQTSGPWTQVRYIEFCDDTDTPYTISSASGIWEDNTSITYSTTGGSQTINDMIANTQKMCAIWRYPDHTMQLTFNLDTAVPCADIAKFRIKLGDDVPERDPKSWKVYFRDAATQIWHIVQDITDAELSDTRNIWSNYYPFDITGATSINVKYGTGLAIDPITGELFVDGQLPEGTIIKKLTYMGDGNNSRDITFDKKPIAILSIYGAGINTKVSACAAPIDAPVLNVSYGDGSNHSGMVTCSMSYDDTTNILTLSGGIDAGARCNMSGETYTMYYLVKGHTGSGTSATNEVSVVKTFSYVGTGASTNAIQFPETPDMLLSIAGVGGDNTYLTTTPTPMDAAKLDFVISDGNNNNGVGGALMSFDDTTNVLTLTSSRSVSWAFNTSGVTYQVRYIINETISSYEYTEGGGISITPDPQTGENIISVNIGSGLSIDPNTGELNVTGGGGGSGDTIAEGAGIEITTDQQTGDKVIAVNTGAGLQVNQTTNELEVSSGVVTSIAPTQNTPGSITVTEGDGTTTPVSVISQLGGATSSTAGTAGYVPAPAAGDDDAYLRGDGTWDDSVVTEDDELTLVFVPDDYQPS